MARRAGRPPFEVTLIPHSDDLDLQEVVDHIRRGGFSGLCGVDPDNTIDMSIRAKNPPDAERSAHSMLEPDYAARFKIHVGIS
jgi:hypothetical protein